MTILKLIEIIDEATYKITKTLQAKYPAVPWAKISGMRHRLVHEYYEIDPKIVWGVATVYIPSNKADFENIIADLS